MKWRPIGFGWAVVALFGLLVWCIPNAIGPQERDGIQALDFGDAKKLRMWVQPHFGDPASIWFEVYRDGQLLQPKQCLGSVRGTYTLQTYWNPDRTVSLTVGTYGQEAGAGAKPVMVYVDWPTGEIWPGDESKMAQWIERRKQLVRANPELPEDPHFRSDSAPEPSK
ncbi:MAG: hypothetical protein ACRCZF_23465 [Gemmataceae bacterium]